MIAYKLLTVRKDGTLGSLFIGKKLRLEVGVWYDAKDGLVRLGFTYRPGWHATPLPYAPHLKLREGRVWAKVEISGVETLDRPEHLGGTWFLARRMRVIHTLPDFHPYTGLGDYQRRLRAVVEGTTERHSNGVPVDMVL